LCSDNAYNAMPAWEAPAGAPAASAAVTAQGDQSISKAARQSCQLAATRFRTALSAARWAAQRARSCAGRKRAGKERGGAFRGRGMEGVGDGWEAGYRGAERRGTQLLLYLRRQG
jgi:hypothetical protein